MGDITTSIAQEENYSKNIVTWQLNIVFILDRFFLYLYVFTLSMTLKNVAHSALQTRENFK